MDALARIAHLDWQVAIMGMTHDENVRLSLMAHRAALGLDERARLTCVSAPAALDNLYRSAPLFSLATRYAGYGMALSEAQLYGLPLESCAVGAVPQIVPSRHRTVDRAGRCARGCRRGRVLAERRQILRDTSRERHCSRGGFDHKARYRAGHGRRTDPPGISRADAPSGSRLWF